MTIAFISDLHLSDSHPAMAKIVFQFLNEYTTRLDQLYILGDFFDTWIGDDNDTPFNRDVIAALKTATQKGLPIYFMHGNRDFLIGKKFLRASGCQLLADEHVIDLYGVPTLLMHGDTLCTLDIAYLKFRKKARNWFIQKLFLLKSLASRRKIAERHRAGSQAHIKNLSDEIMDVTQSEVKRVMQKHQVQHLIHGHTHRLNVHQFDIDGKKAIRSVLGAWHEEGNVLLCEADGEQKFLYLKASIDK